MTLDDYLDIKAMAKLLNVRPESVRRLIRSGKIPAIRVFNKWLVRMDDAIIIAELYSPSPTHGDWYVDIQNMRLQKMLESTRGLFEETK